MTRQVNRTKLGKAQTSVPGRAEGMRKILPPVAHVVLASADSDSYRSLRRRPMPRAERFKLGRSLRQQVPRSSLGDWKAPANRPDPVKQIMHSHEGRLQWLIPIRVGRMVASPYGFLRGTAGVMAQDIAQLPATGICPVICGDAHLGNFGFYASPERDLVIDLNDFDEAHPGAWEWDLRRLIASIWVAGRHNGSSEAQCHDSVASCVAAYRQEVRFLANEPLLSRSYQRFDVDRLHETTREKSLRGVIARAAARTIPNQRSCAAALHHTARRAAADRGRTAADHQSPRGRGRTHRRRAGRIPDHPGATLGPGAGGLHAG